MRRRRKGGGREEEEEKGEQTRGGMNCRMPRKRTLTSTTARGGSSRSKVALAEDVLQKN